MFKILLAIALMAIATAPAFAVEMTSLYTAEVALDKKKRDPRAAAYRAALDEVLLRVSGSDLVADPAMVDQLFPRPAAYVLRFRPGDDASLQVSFDGDAIERVLRDSGQTVWGGDRPLTLVWLAVDWGQGRREIIAADDSEQSDSAARSIDRNRLLRERVLEIAQHRGLPVLFPSMDTEDQRNAGFSDIWGGFDETVLEASARYDVRSVLVGRISPGSSRQNRWDYFFGGAKRSWSGEPEPVIAQVADVLAEEFAISGSAMLESIELSVSGIDTVQAYATVQSMLGELAMVESFAVTAVHGDSIAYRVDARGGAERLRRALRFNGLIEQNGFDALNSRLEFFYSP